MRFGAYGREEAALTVIGASGERLRVCFIWCDSVVFVTPPILSPPSLPFGYTVCSLSGALTIKMLQRLADLENSSHPPGPPAEQVAASNKCHGPFISCVAAVVVLCSTRSEIVS